MNAAKDNSLRVDGATLFYRVRGSGPLLLILPGGDGDADTADALRNDLVARHPEQVAILVAHELPAFELLPDEERNRAIQVQEGAEDAFRTDGIEAGLKRFVQ